MIVRNPKDRYLAIEVLKHPWFKKFGSKTDDVVDATVIDKLRLYRGGSFFKRSAMNMIVRMSVNEDQF